MFTSRRSLFFALIICLFTFSSVAVGMTARFTTINYPNAAHTYALGLNPAGDIVGSYVDTLGHEHGFVLRTGNFTSFDWPGSTWTEGFGINPNGDIVGQYGWFDGNVHGFLLRNGVLYPIDVPGQQNTMPFKINPEGMIVGCLHHWNSSVPPGTDLNTMMGFTMDAAGVTNQTMIRSMNTGVNPEGDVVGYYFGTPSGTTSVRAEWSYLMGGATGLMTWFQFPEAYATMAMDVNPTGTIVGRYRFQTPATLHGFVMEGGQFESFDVPGATQTFPYSISATGDIVGYYVVGTAAAAVYHGFRLRRRGSGL